MAILGFSFDYLRDNATCDRMQYLIKNGICVTR